MGNHEYGIWEEYGKYQMRTTKTKCQNAIRVIDWCKKREKCVKIWKKIASSISSCPITIEKLIVITSEMG